MVAQTTLFPSTTTVKRFVANGGSHYSIRRRSDGLFQVFHDDPYLGINQSYEFTTNNGAASLTARRQRSGSYYDFAQILKFAFLGMSIGSLVIGTLIVGSVAAFTYIAIGMGGMKSPVWVSLTVSALCLLVDAAFSSEPPTDGTLYLETKQPRDTRFVTAIARLTACTITREADPHQMVPQYPPESRKHPEEGKVVMQFLVDSNYRVRRATILQSSGYFRLDKASLDYAMNLKFPPSMLGKATSADDGQKAFAFPIVWKLIPAVPFVPGDRCSGDATCVDNPPPPPKVEVMGTPPNPGDTWMPGHYAYFAKTGYQWTDGQWESSKPGYHWNAPHWDKFNAKWVFVPGVWQKDQ